MINFFWPSMGCLVKIFQNFLFTNLQWVLLTFKHDTRAYYRNKYREGGDCLDIEDRGWVV